MSETGLTSGLSRHFSRPRPNLCPALLRRLRNRRSTGSRMAQCFCSLLALRPIGAIACLRRLPWFFLFLLRSDTQNTESHQLNMKEGPICMIGPSSLLEEVGMTT